MPSQSKKQHNLMAMVANDPAAAKRVGIKQSVGKDYMQADKGKKFGTGLGGQTVDINKQKTHHTDGGIPNVSLNRMVGKAKGGSVENDKAQEERHARTLRQLAKEEQSEADKMARGGAVMKKPNPFVGGETPGKEKAEKKLPPWLYKKGEKSEGEMACGGKVKKMANGGSASSRADGIASKGKTRGKIC